MAIRYKDGGHAIGITFTYEIDSPIDRHNLKSGIYFYELSSKQVWYKLNSSTYLNFWDYKSYTDIEIAKLDDQISDIYNKLIEINSFIINNYSTIIETNTKIDDSKAFALAMAITL